MLICYRTFFFFFSLFLLFYSITMVNCFVCSKNHPLKYCLTFRKMLFTERYDTVFVSGLCLNCFHNDHKRSNCPSTNRCQTCKRRHHTMIHRDVGEVGSINFEEPEPTSPGPVIQPLREVHDMCHTNKDRSPTIDDIRDLDVQEIASKFGEINFHDIISKQHSSHTPCSGKKESTLALTQNTLLHAIATPTTLSPLCDTDAILALKSPATQSSLCTAPHDQASKYSMNKRQWAVTGPS